MPFRGRQVGLVRGDEMPFAQGVGVPAALDEHLGQARVLERDPPVGAGEAAGHLRDTGHAVAGRVPPGQQARTRRRTQRRGVEIGELHSHLGEPSHRLRLHQPAEDVEGAEPDVVPHQVQHVRCAVRGLRLFVRLPSGTECRMSSWITPLKGMAIPAVSFVSPAPHAHGFCQGDVPGGTGRVDLIPSAEQALKALPHRVTMSGTEVT